MKNYFLIKYTDATQLRQLIEITKSTKMLFCKINNILHTMMDIKYNNWIDNIVTLL